MAFYLLAFCRFALLFLFLTALVGKVRGISQFAQTVADFRLLPPWLSQPAVFLFLAGELAVILLLLAGGSWLPLAFALAGLLLTLFSLALLSALRRNIQTSCSCFGNSDKPLTYYDVWRNVSFMACSLLGWWLAAQVLITAQPLNWVELAMAGFLAALFVMVWTQLSEVAMLLANQK
jgi:hypothetical protein